MAKYAYFCTALTGGTSGCLDKIDGDNLADQDVALVVIQSEQKFYIFSLDEDSGATESSPDVISPDSNAGDKRWVLVENYGGLSDDDHKVYKRYAFLMGHQ